MEQPWYYIKLHELCKLRHSLLCHAQATNNNEAWAKYKKVRNTCNYEQNSLKKKFYAEKVAGYIKYNPKEGWKHMRVLFGKGLKNNMQISLKINGNKKSEPLTVANHFLEFFVTSVHKIVKSFDDVIMHEPILHRSHPSKENGFFNFACVTAYDIYKAIMACKKYGNKMIRCLIGNNLFDIVDYTWLFSTDAKR